MTRGERTSPFCGDGCMGCKLTMSGLAGIGIIKGSSLTIHCRGRMSAGLTWSDLRFSDSNSLAKTVMLMRHG